MLKKYTRIRVRKPTCQRFCRVKFTSIKKLLAKIEGIKIFEKPKILR